MIVEDHMSSTACYNEYIREDFQLTHAESVLCLRYTDMPHRFPAGLEIPSIRLIVMDGELHFLDDGSPPDSRPLPVDAGLLHARQG